MINGGGDSSSNAGEISNIAAGGASEIDPQTNGHAVTDEEDTSEDLTILRTEYRATTNRMLRVAVNGFMESLGVVLGVMEELDVDVLAEKG